MPLVSPVVFPLFGINPDGTCACGRASCSRIGKHPAVRWKELSEGSPVPRPAEGAGVGIKTGARPKGSGVFVVDVDSLEALGALEKLGPLPETYAIGTGKGYHYYFRHPGFHVRNSVSELGKGIDVRGDGGFVVAAGSPHQSGAKYFVDFDVEPAPAPAWLLEWLRKQSKPLQTQTYEGDVSGSERDRRIALYAKYLQETEPCVAGQGGDKRLFEVVQYGAYDLALPTEDVLDLVAEHFDPRCEPPWGNELEARVAHKAHSAKTTSTRARKVPLLESEENALAELFEPTRLPVPTETKDEDLDCGFKIQWGGWSARPIPPEYLVEDLLIEGKVSMVFAEPGSIKSWTAIDLAACVSQGIPWLRERVVRQGPVLYVDFEDGELEFHRRVHLLAKGEERPHLGYIYTPGRMDDEAVWLRLEKLTKSRGIRLLVLDTLAGGTPGVDENDRNAADALTFAGRFTEATLASVLVLHHANRAGEIRGTSAFKANVDSLFKLETLKDENGVHQAKLTCTKSGQKKVHTVYLELTDAGLTKFDPPEKVPVDDGKDAKADKRTLDQLQQEILLLISHGGPWASIEKIREQVKAKTSRVSAIISELQAAGDIVKLEEGWVRDSEALRCERLRSTILEHDDWARGKLLAQAVVSKEFFEKQQRLGRVVPKASGRDVVGYLWIDS